MMNPLMQDILKLSISERILMVEAIWNSISENSEQTELSHETKELLDNRLDAHNTNSNEGDSWEDVKVRIKKQL